MVENRIDFPPPITLGRCNRPGLTLACGSHSGPRWFCAQAEPRRETEARDKLDGNGFAAFLPLVLVQRRHARQVKLVQRPMFPGYLFVRLDLAEASWRGAAHTRHIRRLFGSTPESPTPLALGIVERMIALGFDRPVTDDPVPDLIAAGAVVAITDGPFADHRGVCLWSDAKRCRVLLSMLGGQVQATLPRRLVAVQ